MSGKVQSLPGGGWQYSNTTADTGNTSIWYANLHVEGDGYNGSWENVEHLYKYWLSKGALPVDGEENLKSMLEKGDLLFYDYDGEKGQYDHVAIVVDNQYLAPLSGVDPVSRKFDEILSDHNLTILISHRGSKCGGPGHALVDYDAEDTTDCPSLHRREFGLKMPY